ncbi:hypothetical protein BO70DRAFT_358170 [Aspergillus heteromorphus CBS 117.55]|uniref:Uncharacterized protein n=1 Tax=Aspergillus heteromorphus CBS 117.55 TaxID=1448321 RepID=A0A317WZH2_9EURO|nr:uncharacterized protein BO70DRAFT_358170 [Aspergillus heteromorphus CBS 117.55]PWY90722.1 hypothetical protein BO70DRAFT_358170 [Aspergillus heteromorphus CBS 117.55]
MTMTMNSTRFTLPLRTLNRTVSPQSRILLPPSPSPATATTLLLHQTRHHTTTPKFAQSSIWHSLIPKSLRNRNAKQTRPYTPKSKEWNPASFYIIIFILIGSQAIRMIALKNDYAAYTRSTDAKIRLMREVIEKVNAGEKVDVEKLLGTEDQGKEREWEDVLREIEAEDSLWHRKNAARAGQEQEQEQQMQEEEEKKKKKQKALEESSKDSVVPAEGPAGADLPADSAAKKKLNFF